MKPLHPQVRIVDFGGTPCALYAVELYDGEVWEASHSAPLPRARAEQRARWLSDVLEHARDSALEEAAKVVDASRAILAFCECDPDIGHTGACKRLTDALQEYDALKGVRDA